MLMYMATVLTGTFLLRMLWGLLTFLVFRDLLDNRAIADKALRAGKSEWELQERRRSLAHVAAANTVGPDGKTVRLDNPGTATKDAAWMEAAEKRAEQEGVSPLRRKSTSEIESAEGTGKPGLAESKEREQPRQLDYLDTSGMIRLGLCLMYSLRVCQGQCRFRKTGGTKKSRRVTYRSIQMRKVPSFLAKKLYEE